MSTTLATLSRRHLLAGISGLAGLGLTGARAEVLTSPRPIARGTPVAAAPRPDPAAATRALIARTKLSGAVSCLVIDAASGASIAEVDPGLALPPASVLKSVTAAYAFDLLGPGWQFTTRLIGTGPLRDGRLEGDLVLAGGGAPDLDTDGLAQLAFQLRMNGVAEVAGDFLVWDGALPRIDRIDPGQPDHLGYNASVSGLNLNYNRVHFGWRQAGADYVLRMEAGDGGGAPKVTHSAMQLAARSKPLYSFATEADTGREVWSVARGALGTGGTRWLPVRDSALYAGEVFQSLAQAEGIRLPPARRTGVAPRGAVLASLDSPSLFSVAEGMLAYSNNLTAEVLGLSATAARRGTQPLSLADSATDMTQWARGALGMTSSAFVDHSGLGPGSRVTAADLCGAYRRLGTGSTLRRALKEIPLRDADGRSLPVLVQAKTGTLNFVSALAGYVQPFDGDPMIFAILTADLGQRALVPPGEEDDPPGAAWWANRSRGMQRELLKLWSGVA